MRHGEGAQASSRQGPSEHGGGSFQLAGLPALSNHDPLSGDPVIDDRFHETDHIALRSGARIPSISGPSDMIRIMEAFD